MRRAGGASRAATPDEPGRAAVSAIHFAIALIAARSLPEKKLREKVAARYDADETDKAIARMRELRLVDDAAWAERFVRDRVERSDKGRHRIRQELVRFGIDRSAIDVAFERVLAGHDERERASRALDRMRARLGRGPVTERASSASAPRGSDATPRGPDVEKNRLFRRMIARGYPVDLVRDLLDVS